MSVAAVICDPIITSAVMSRSERCFWTGAAARAALANHVRAPPDRPALAGRAGLRCACFSALPLGSLSSRAACHVGIYVSQRGSTGRPFYHSCPHAK